ncbi:MAG: (R,R)-butanediol dehydrogenase / meso-butanediol dehydrogenase / diacetyl reductase [Abditibacteriota bacterium]|nr:(R,R)-butanediol dehydrogenase / meso-butanediol dehydrogenase / diacetyl reductase [Abditibacteriota bacterium]
MKALVLSAFEKLEMQERETPHAAAGEVLVRVRATGICGSDVHGFLGHHARRQPGLVLGHETVGEVQAVGKGVDASLVGSRVAVNPLISCMKCRACSAGRHNCCAQWQLLGLDQTAGAFAEAVTIPARNVHPLPEHVTDAAAVMIEPLANAFHLLSHIPAQAGLLPTAAIFGCGTLGAAILSVAQARGLQVVAQSERNPQRARVAAELGAARVLNPQQDDVVSAIMEATGGRGVDVAIDAVGTQETRSAAVKSVARGGTVLLLGLDEMSSSFDFSDIMRREVRLQCSFAYAETDFAAALDFVCRGAADYSRWTDVLPMEHGQEAFEQLIKDPGDRLKLVLQP